MSVAHLQANLPGMLHAGHKAAPAKPKATGKKRKDMLLQRGRFWQEIEKKRTVENLFKKYDVSNTGYLSASEVAKFLQDAAQGEAPTEQEVGFVMMTTHDKTGVEGKGITMSELKTALDVWKTWQGLKPEMEMYMKKYDVNQSGKLENDQVKSLLKDLNEGVEPTDEEVQWVMDGADGVYGTQKTGGINRCELQGAITMWYTHVQSDGAQGGGGGGGDEARGTSGPAPVADKKASACCRVS